MLTSILRTLATAALLAGCDNFARGESTMPETIRVAVGMSVEEFNAQPAVARQPVRLDPREAGVFVMGEPHRLALDVNGHAVRFETGAPRAFTYVTSGFYVHESLEGRDRIASVDFEARPEPATLREAVALARSSCASMRAAGLSPRREPARFGVINEALGSGANRPVADEEALIAAFTDPAIRARTVVLCELEDDGHVFALSITNGRRAREQHGDGDGSEDDVESEREYGVTVHFAQNLDAAISRGEGTARD